MNVPTGAWYGLNINVLVTLDMNYEFCNDLLSMMINLASLSVSKTYWEGI